MNRTALALTLVALLPAAAVPSWAGDATSDARIARVHSDVEALLHAVYRGDLDTMFEFTHPSVIKMLGGEKAARATMAAAMQQVSRLGMRLESLSFPRAPDFLEGGGRKFAVVPTLSIAVARGQRIESLNYQFGILEPGSARWSYIEGSRINRENVRSLFPEFPVSYEFPPIYRKKL